MAQKKADLCNIDPILKPVGCFCVTELMRVSIYRYIQTLFVGGFSIFFDSFVYCSFRKHTTVFAYLRRNWGGEYENVAILVAIAVNKDGYREVLSAAEGMKEDKASWVSFFQWLHGRGLDGVKLAVDDKCLGMLEAVGKVFP